MAALPIILCKGSHEAPPAHEVFQDEPRPEVEAGAEKLTLEIVRPAAAISVATPVMKN